MTAQRYARLTDEAAIPEAGGSMVRSGGAGLRLEGALVVAAMLAALASLGASGGVNVPREVMGRLVVLVRDRSTHVPVGCVNAILLWTKRGAASDSVGVADIPALPVGDYRLRLMRIGYADTTLVAHVEGGTADTLRCEMRRWAARAPTCREIRDATGWENPVEPNLPDSAGVHLHK